MDAFWAAPPVIRTLTAAVVVTSIAVYGGILDGYKVLFFPRALFRFPPQLYRLATAFWLTGPQLSIVFDPYFLYTYGSQLEKDSPRFPRAADFFVYVIFVQVLILALCGFGLGGVTFLQPLILAFVYTYAQENQRRRVSLWFFQFEARFLPFALVGMTFIMAGPGAALQQATGYFAAHAYEFLTRIWPTYGGGSNLLQTPQFIVRAFKEDRPAPRTKGYGTAFPGRPAAQSGSGGGSGSSSAGVNSSAGAAAGSGGSGWSSAFSGWSHRGPGRRLGGD